LLHDDDEIFHSKLQSVRYVHLLHLTTIFKKSILTNKLSLALKLLESLNTKSLVRLIVDQFGKTLPFIIAEWNGDYSFQENQASVIEMLIKHCGCQNQDGQDLVGNAVNASLLNQNQLVWKKLLQIKGNTCYCETCPHPLVTAIRQSNLIASLLLGQYEIHKWECTLHSKQGYNALHLAVIHNMPSLVNTLLSECRQLLHQKDHLGWTPMYYALRGYCCPIIESLLKAGADVNLRNNLFDTTPLMEVSKWGNRRLCDLLCSFGKLGLNA